MTALFIYLIKANIALCLFYLAYRLGLRRLTFYTLNRVFLITGIVFSSLFPLVDVNDFFSRNETIAAQVVQYVPDFSMLQQTVQPEAFTVWTLLEWVFWTGVAVMAFRLMIQLVSLLVLHIRTKPEKVQDHDVRIMEGNINPFSFFRNIYVNPEMHTEEELEAIIRHEHVHVSQWHSADVMMSEVNNVFYWFNPGAWLMKTAVKENLEFITDRKILRSGVNATAYQYSLVKVSTAQYAAGVANNFNFSHLKNRIMMMNKTKSSRLHLYRYGVLAGVVCGVLLSLNYTKAGTVVNHVVSEVRDALDMQKDTLTPMTTAPAKNEPAVEKVKSAEDKFKTLKADEFQAIREDEFTLGPAGITMTTKADMAKADVITITGNKTVLRGRVSGIAMTTAGDTSASPNVTFTPRGSASTSAGTGTLMKMSAVGNGPSLTFRADTSRQPLIVLDGKPYPPGISGYPTLSNLNGNDIESITVLKDKSAAAIYGEAGENGVILIVTKKGATHKLKEVTVTGYPAPEKEEHTLNQVVVVGYGTKTASDAKPDVEEVVVTGRASKPAAEAKEVLVTGYPSKAAAVEARKKAEEPEEVTVTGYSSKPVAKADSADAGGAAANQKNVLLTFTKDNGNEHTKNSLYPNPTKGIVNLAFYVPKASGNNFIEVKDMNGKTLYRQSLSGFKGSYKGQVDLSRYPAGSYVVRVKLSDSDMSSMIMKQ